MSMSPEVRREYEGALARVVIRCGNVVKSCHSIYGWSDYDATMHLRRCGVTSHGVPVETEWYEFVGTFDDNAEVHGVMLSSVTCTCGRLSRRSLRWAGTVHEVAEAVFEEALGRRSAEQ